MRHLFLLLLGITIGAGGMYFAFRYHVVRAEEGVLLVPRHNATLTDAYADVRAWDAAEWQKHPDLIRSLVARGRGDLIVEPLSRNLIENLFRQFTDDRR